jgi:hypothetical protein
VGSWYSVWKQVKTLREHLFLLDSLASSLVQVSLKVNAIITDKLIVNQVFSLLAPMLALLAKDIKEVGVRMGICFTFTGLYFPCSPFPSYLPVPSGLGGLIGT